MIIIYNQNHYIFCKSGNLQNSDNCSQETRLLLHLVILIQSDIYCRTKGSLESTNCINHPIPCYMAFSLTGTLLKVWKHPKSRQETRNSLVLDILNHHTCRLTNCILCGIH